MPDENSAVEPEGSDEENAPSDEGALTETGSGGHAAPEGAPLHPLIDLSRDPTPGKPDHARPDGE